MSDEVYQAVKAAYKSYGVFIKAMAETVGWETVLQIRKKIGRRDMDSVVLFLKTKKPETRLAEFGKMSSDWYNKSGWVMETEATAIKDVATIHTCPIFDGFHEAGFSVEEVNLLCKAVHRGMDERLKEDFPDASFSSIVKKSKDSDCIEQINLPL
jgi:hypothetical protein